MRSAGVGVEPTYSPPPNTQTKNGAGEPNTQRRRGEGEEGERGSCLLFSFLFASFFGRDSPRDRREGASPPPLIVRKNTGWRALRGLSSPYLELSSRVKSKHRAGGNRGADGLTPFLSLPSLLFHPLNSLVFAHSLPPNPLPAISLPLK